MARDRSPVVKQSRRENFALHPKAHKYLIKKTGIPGQHGGSGRRRGSNNQYTVQLREKQKVRRLYGLMEKQFATLFKKAVRSSGQGGEKALISLERRLDNAVYQGSALLSVVGAPANWSAHKHFTLNGRRVNIASIQLFKSGDRSDRASSQSSAQECLF